MKRLADFLPVVISPPTGGSARSDAFDCHVVAVVSTTVGLEPVSRRSTLSLPEVLEDVIMSFEHDGSLVALKGTLIQREEVGDLRFSVTDGVCTLGRPASQIVLRAPVTLRAAGTGATCEGLTAALSADGLVVDCELAVEAGDEVYFELALPGTDEAVESSSRAARLGDGRLELAIDPAARRVRARLGRFVLEHNRTILRRRRQTSLELDF
jgi:hypothetical protein